MVHQKQNAVCKTNKYMSYERSVYHSCLYFQVKEICFEFNNICLVFIGNVFNFIYQVKFVVQNMLLKLEKKNKRTSW